MKNTHGIIAGGPAAALAAISAPAQMVENYTRYADSGPQTIAVQVVDGKLFCARESDGFEMCHRHVRCRDMG